MSSTRIPSSANPGVVATTRDGKQVQLRVGYQMKSRQLFLKMKDGTVVTSSNLTHQIALRMIKEAPGWFRVNMTRGWYMEDSAYWT